VAKSRKNDSTERRDNKEQKQPVFDFRARTLGQNQGPYNAQCLELLKSNPPLHIIKPSNVSSEVDRDTCAMQIRPLLLLLTYLLGSSYRR